MLPPSWKWKLDRWVDRLRTGSARREESRPPRLCPACRTLVGSAATRCHECGASMSVSLAALSGKLSRYLPETSPVTYCILGINVLLFVICLMRTMHWAEVEGEAFSFHSGIHGEPLFRLGARQVAAILQHGELWRLVMPIFLHGSIFHIGMNTWVLMDVGPQVEEVYGSARFLFLYVATGIASFLVSTAWAILTFNFGGLAIGASGALMGLIGLMLAITTRRGGIMMQMLRRDLIRWIIYIGILGLVMGGIDNAAHAGGLAAGYLLGKVFADRQPANSWERNRAYGLAWGTAATVLASFILMIARNLRG